MCLNSSCIEMIDYVGVLLCCCLCSCTITCVISLASHPCILVHLCGMLGQSQGYVIHLVLSIQWQTLYRAVDKTLISVHLYGP